MLFDIFLLIMRDADLWDDFSVWVQKKSGRIGVVLLRFAELLAGPDMASIGDGKSKGKKSNMRLAGGVHDCWDDEPSEKEVETVKREVGSAKGIYFSFLMFPLAILAHRELRRERDAGEHDLAHARLR